MILALASPAILIVAVALTVLVLPWIVTKERVREEAVSALTDLLGSCVKIDRVEYHPLSGVELFGVELCAPPGFDEIPFAAERIAVRYDLSGVTSKRVRVEAVAIDGPHLILETKHGKRNLDAILEKLSSGKPKEPDKEPFRPLSGPLSPFDVKLARLSIGPATIETKGEGPKARVEGLTISLDAGIDPRQLGADLLISIDPTRSKDAINVAADVPGADPLAARLGLTLTASASVRAQTHDGIALEVAKLGGRVRAKSDLRRGATVIPRSELEFAFGFETKPGEDSAKLGHVTLQLDRASIIRAGARIDGLTALLEGHPATSALAALFGAHLGLRRGKGEGTVQLTVDHLAIPMTELAPYVEVFAPGTEVAGRIALSPLAVEGTPAELVEGSPRKLNLALALDDVTARAPAQGLVVGSLDGSITAARGRGGSVFQIDGAITAAGVDHPAAKVKHAQLELHAGINRLAWPIPGESSASVALTVHDVVAPAARVARAKIVAGLDGDAIFAPDREGREPIAVSAGVELSQVRAVTGTRAIDVSHLQLGARAKLDRLLQPALSPIDAEIDLSVGGVALPGGTEVSGTKLNLQALVTDPRPIGREIDARGKLALQVAGVVTPEAELAGAKIEAKFDAAAIGKRHLPDTPRTGPPGTLPANAAIELDVELPKVTLHDAKYGDIETSLSLSTKSRADLVRGVAVIEALKLAVADTVKMRASGQARRFMAADRWVDAKVDIEPIDLAKLIASLPKQIFEAAPGIPTRGKVGLELSAKGTAPADFANLDLASPPIDADVVLGFDDIDLEMATKGLGITDLGGAIRLGVRKGKTAVDSTIKVAQIRALADKTGQGIDGLILTSTAALRGEMWSISVDADQRPELFGLERLSKSEAGSKITIDIAYPKRGDLDLRRFEVRLPRAGVDLAVSGGLMRRRFGVLRPELSVRASLDLDRLRPFVPEVGDAHGAVALDLSIRSKIDTVLEVHGQIEADHLSYTIPDVLAVQQATGRIPLDQQILIPVPIMREQVAAGKGNLGDDFEARLKELQADVLSGKLILDADDILVEAPRAADYQSLRPYLADTGARVSIERLVYGAHELRNIALEALWSSGVFRVDRFAAEMWEGDVLADFALQVTADQDARARIRATVTALNLDIPYATAKKIPPVSDPEEKELYKVAGTMDFKFGLRERSLNGTIDLARLRKPTVERLFGVLDPSGKNPGIGGAAVALDLSEDFGLRPIAGKVWISQNLMGLSLDWQRLPIYLKFKSPGAYFESLKAFGSFFWDLSLVFARPVLVLTAGSFIVNTVNGAFDKFSVTNILEPMFDNLKLEERLALLSGKVIAAEAPEAEAGSGEKAGSP